MHFLISFFLLVTLVSCGTGDIELGSGEIISTDDDFLWLEEVEGKKALSWVERQNKQSLKKLQKDKRYNNYFEEAKKILTASDKIPWGKIRGNHVYNFWQDGEHIRGVWRRTNIKDYRRNNPKWEVLIDFDKLAKEENENWVYKKAVCRSPEYDRCLIGISRGGKDAVVFREYDLKTKKFLKNGFYFPENKTGVSWIDKDTLFLSTKTDEGSVTKSGYPRIARVIKRGQKVEEAKIVLEVEEDDMGAWAWTQYNNGKHDKYLVRSIEFYKREYFFLNDNYEAEKIPLPEDARLEEFFRGQWLFSLRNDLNFGNKTLRQGILYSFDWKKTRANKKLMDIKEVYVPDRRSSLESATAVKDYVLITTNRNVKSELWKYSFVKGKWNRQRVRIPAHSSVSISSADAYSNRVLLAAQSFTLPHRLMYMDETRTVPVTWKSLPARFDSRNVEVDQLWAKSKDGTKVPYFVIAPKGYKRNGNNKTLLYGYGGFEVSLTPWYPSVAGKLWIERGGIYVVANIRGGGEFGPAWHRAALKENRHKAFEDFIAVAEDLNNRKITSPKHLGIYGGSNGGLLVGATFVLRPDLFNAVVCSVPLLDMLRYNKLLAGASWIGEYGNPDEEAMREALASYSPYHNVRPDKTYPEVFFVTSTKDDRVHPGHARKMVAKMKAQGHKVYYYENTEGGHSASANQLQKAKLTALRYVYLDKQL